MEFFGKTNFDFISKRKIAYTISIILLIISAVAIIMRGGFNFGIDFVGGTLVQTKMSPTPEVNMIRKVLDENGLKGAQLQHFKQGDEIIIKVRNEEIAAMSAVNTPAVLANSGAGAGQTALTETSQLSVKKTATEQIFSNILTKAFPSSSVEITRVEMVGPAIGKKLLKQAMLALIWGLIGIMIYVGWRFEFKFSAPAVIAIAHDLFIIAGIFALLKKEVDMTTVAALLTIAGYSINDTIIVYDRIREKRRLFAKDELDKVMNLAINETLSRTVITVFSVIIVLFVIFFFGGEVLHNFAFAMIVGTIVGTYSSIFVASPLVYDLERSYRKK